MHFTQLHFRKREADGRHHRSPQSGSTHHSQAYSVGQQLKAALGDRYSIAWLATQLQCSRESAEALDGYWIVHNAHGRTQMLTVFARTLDIESQRLLALFADADRSAPARPPRKPAIRTPQQAPVSVAPAPQLQPQPQPQPQKQITIGSNDGIREIRRSQPKIEWRRARVPAPGAA